MKKPSTYAILGLLSIKPMTGYEVKQWIDGALSHIWSISFGHIYPTLSKFVKEGLATVEVVENESRPNAKRYSITEAGEFELKKWIENDTFDINIKDEELLRLTFSFDLPNKELERRFELYKKQYVDRWQEYEDIINRNDYETKTLTKQETLFYLSLKKGVMINQVSAEWVDLCRTFVSDLRESNV